MAMSPPSRPSRPFSTYKWTFASYDPTEGLHDPAVTLALLRAMRANLGQKKSSTQFARALRAADRRLNNQVPQFRMNLARQAQKRNVLRNSGQYLQALGLMPPSSRGKIDLTPLGLRLADGGVTMQEFAAATVNSLTLPNLRVRPDTWSEWSKSKLVIRPLHLLLQILLELYRGEGPEAATISVSELLSVVIPLAGVSAPLSDHIKGIRSYRNNPQQLASWPNCAPGSKDERCAAEFLVFLEKHGFCVRKGHVREKREYHLNTVAVASIQELLEVRVHRGTGDVFDSSLDALRAQADSTDLERKRRLVAQWDRPQQRKFKKRVMAACNSKCVLSGETVAAALEAAHIIPVGRYNGSDQGSNGLLLRADLHALFDSGHIRIQSNGSVVVSEALDGSPTYGGLKNRKATLPSSVHRALEWRWHYQ
jgi:hypothetical protein